MPRILKISRFAGAQASAGRPPHAPSAFRNARLFHMITRNKRCAVKSRRSVCFRKANGWPGVVQVPGAGRIRYRISDGRNVERMGR